MLFKDRLTNQRHTWIFFFYFLNFLSDFLHVEPLYNSVSTYNPITGQMYAGFEDGPDETPTKGKRAHQNNVMGNGGQSSISVIDSVWTCFSIVAPFVGLSVAVSTS